MTTANNNQRTDEADRVNGCGRDRVEFGCGKGVVTEDVLEESHDLSEVCEDDLMMLIAKMQLPVVKSYNGLANNLARRLGSSSYARTRARNLGVGYRAGKAKRKCKCASMEK